MDSPRSVLIVDTLDETREVLQMALARRGLRTFTAPAAKRGLQLAHEHHPDLIVLDLESDSSECADLFARFCEPSASGHSRLVILGEMRRSQCPSSGEFVAKPYHYAALIRKIEELLDDEAPSDRSHKSAAA